MPAQEHKTPGPLDQTLNVDQEQLAAFVDVMFRGADPGTYASIRAFPEQAEGAPSIEPVKLNGDPGKLVKAAIRQAQRAADQAEPWVFAPPIATFTSPDKAREVDLACGLALSVELDHDPERGLKRLEDLLGLATVVVASGGTWVDPTTGEVQDKLHVHWRLTEPTRGSQAHARLKQARTAATQLVGGDCTNKPIVHPIRWPGSWHRKAEPRLCRTVTLNSEAEIDLDAALDALPKFREPIRMIGDAGAGEDRDTTALVRKVINGEEYHAALRDLAWRYLQGGMADAQAVITLRGFMDASSGDHDERWEHRRGQIPELVRTAREKISGKRSDFTVEMLRKIDLEKGDPEVEVVPEAAANDNREGAKSSFDEKSQKLKLRGGNLEELMQKDLPELKWQVDGLLPDGFHLLAAVPKKGKSFFVYQLAIAKATGGVAFGEFSCKRSEKPEVLMLALEDGERRLQDRFEQLSDSTRAPRGLYYYLDWPRLDDGGVELLDTFLRGHPKVGLVTIDLLTNFLGDEDAGKSQYVGDYQRHVSITKFAGVHRVAILGVTHTREMVAGDAIDKVFGSRGVSGAVDGIFVMDGDRYEPECKIQRMGRDFQDKVYEFTRDGVRWVYKGEAESEGSELERQILEVLAIRKRPTLPSEIAKILEANAGSVRKALRRMASREKVEQPIPGKYVKARSWAEIAA